MTFDELLAGCRTLPRISPEASEAYAQATEKLLVHVSEQLETNPKIKELIGHNPFELVWNNIRKHAVIMSIVFKINSDELLIRTILWMYRTNCARGITYDYFPTEYVAWQIALHECLKHHVYNAEIRAFYKWLVQHHEDMILLSLSNECHSFSVQSEAYEMQHTFLALLLIGNSEDCLLLADQSIQTVEDLKHFYLDVVWPSMIKIGQMWETNQISVVEEHLATAIAGRVIAVLFSRFACFTVTRGKAVVSAGPNEFHELGARMVADFLEMDGWDVTFLRANSSVSELLGIIKQLRPFIVSLSVSTVFNLDKAFRAIKRIRELPENTGVKILVGGHAFNEIPNIWPSSGADGYAADAHSAALVCNEWWLKGNSTC